MVERLGMKVEIKTDNKTDADVQRMQKQLTRVLTQKMAELVDANAQDVLSFKEALHSLVVDTLPTDWSLSPQATGLTGSFYTKLLDPTTPLSHLKKHIQPAGDAPQTLACQLFTLPTASPSGVAVFQDLEAFPTGEETVAPNLVPYTTPFAQARPITPLISVRALSRDHTSAKTAPSSQPMQITVKSLSGLESSLCVSNANLVIDVKRMIVKQMHQGEGALAGSQGDPPSDFLRLLFAGKQLEDNRSLHEYNVTAGSSLNLVLNLRAGMLHHTSGMTGFQRLPSTSEVAVKVRMPDARVEMRVMDQTATVESLLSELMPSETASQLDQQERVLEAQLQRVRAKRTKLNPQPPQL